MSDEIVAATTKSRINYLLILTFVIAIAALLLTVIKRSPDSTVSVKSALSEIERTKVLRVGYEGYPPYTIKDPISGKLSGYSVDIANYIAEETGWSVRWVKSTADTKISDLKAGSFDVMVEPIFRTIPRATEVCFTRPYAYFGYAAGIVRKGDTRFSRFEDLNRADITVVVRLGYASQTFAEVNLPLAKIRKPKVESISQVFQEVISGQADIALSDVEQVKAFAREHSEKVDAIFVESPPASVPAGFMLKQGDFTFYNFLNSTIDYLEANGILDQLDERYDVSAVREKKMWSAQGD